MLPRRSGVDYHHLDEAPGGTMHLLSNDPALLADGERTLMGERGQELSYLVKEAGGPWKLNEGAWAQTNAVWEDVHCFRDFVALEGREISTGIPGVWITPSAGKAAPGGGTMTKLPLTGAVELDRDLAWLSNNECDILPLIDTI